MKDAKKMPLSPLGGGFSFKGSNLLARLLCLFFAVLLWLYVMSVESPTYETTFSSVPVNVVLSEENNLSVISGGDSVVNISASGRKSLLASYTNDDIYVSVDATGITEAGTQSLKVNVSAPSGVTVEKVTPSTLTVYLDEIATKTVPVKVNITGVIFDSAYELGDPVPDATDAVVRGPAGVVDEISYARVDIAPGKISASTSARGELIPISKNGSEIDNPYITVLTAAQSSSVGVKIPLYLEKEIPLAVTTKYGFYNETNTEIKISPSVILVRGEPSAVEAATEISIAELDEKQIGTNNTQIVRISMPDGFENMSAYTTATISVKHTGTVTKAISVPVTDIKIRNANGVKYTALADSVNITMRVPEEYSASLSAADIAVSAELNYSAGNVSLPLTITVSSKYGGAVYELGEYSIAVNVANG